MATRFLDNEGDCAEIRDKSCLRRSRSTRGQKMKRLSQASNCHASSSALLTPREQGEKGMQHTTVRSASLSPPSHYSKQSTVKSTVPNEYKTLCGQNQSRTHKTVFGSAPAQGGYSSPEHILKQRFRSSKASFVFTQGHYPKGTLLPSLSASSEAKTPLLGETKNGGFPSRRCNPQNEESSGSASLSLKSPEVSFLTARSLPSGDDFATESLVEEPESETVFGSGLNGRSEATQDGLCFVWKRHEGSKGPGVEERRLKNHGGRPLLRHRDGYEKGCFEGSTTNETDSSLSQKRNEGRKIGLEGPTKELQTVPSQIQRDGNCKPHLEEDQKPVQNDCSCIHSQAGLSPTRVHQEHLNNNEVHEILHNDTNLNVKKTTRRQTPPESLVASVSFYSANPSTRCSWSSHSPVLNSDGKTQSDAHTGKQETSGENLGKAGDRHDFFENPRVAETVRKPTNRDLGRSSVRRVENSVLKMEERIGGLNRTIIGLPGAASPRMQKGESRQKTHWDHGGFLTPLSKNILFRFFAAFLFLPTEPAPCGMSAETNKLHVAAFKNHQTAEPAGPFCGSMNPFVLPRRRSVDLLPSKGPAGRPVEDFPRSKGSRRRSCSSLTCNEKRQLPVPWPKKDGTPELANSRHYYVAKQKNGRSLRVHVALTDSCPQDRTTVQKPVSARVTSPRRDRGRQPVAVCNAGKASKSPARLTRVQKRVPRAVENAQHHDPSTAKATDASSLVGTEHFSLHRDSAGGNSHGNVAANEKSTVERTESLDRQILEHSWMFPRDEYRPPLSPEIPFSLDDEDEDSFSTYISHIDTRSAIPIQQISCRITPELQGNDADKTHPNSDFSLDEAVRGHQESPASYVPTVLPTNQRSPLPIRRDKRVVAVPESRTRHFAQKNELLQESIFPEEHACPKALCLEYRRSQTEELGLTPLKKSSESTGKLGDNGVSRPHPQHAATAEVILFPLASPPNERHLIGAESTAMAGDCSTRFSYKGGRSESAKHLTKNSGMCTDSLTESWCRLSTFTSSPCSPSTLDNRPSRHTSGGRGKNAEAAGNPYAGSGSVRPSAASSVLVSVGKEGRRESREDSGCLCCHVACDSCSTVDTVSRRTSGLHLGGGVLYTPAESPLPTDLDDLPSDRWEYETLQRSRFVAAAAESEAHRKVEKGSKTRLPQRCTRRSGVPAASIETPRRTTSSATEAVEADSDISYRVKYDRMLPKRTGIGTSSKDSGHKRIRPVHTAASNSNGNGPASGTSLPQCDERRARNAQRQAEKFLPQISGLRSIRPRTTPWEEEQHSPADAEECIWGRTSTAEPRRFSRIRQEIMEEGLLRRVRKWREIKCTAADLAGSVEPSATRFLRHAQNQTGFLDLHWKATGGGQRQDSSSSDGHNVFTIQPKESLLSPATAESQWYSSSPSSRARLGLTSSAFSGCSPRDPSVTDSLLRRAAAFVEHKQSVLLQANRCRLERAREESGCQSGDTDDGKSCRKDPEQVTPNGASLRSQADSTDEGNESSGSNPWSLRQLSAVACRPWKLLAAPLFLDFPSSSTEETEADSSDWSSSCPSSEDNTPRAFLCPRASCYSSAVGDAFAQPPALPLQLGRRGFFPDDLGNSLSSVSAVSEQDKKCDGLITPSVNSRSRVVERNDLQDAMVCCFRWFRSARRHIPHSTAGNSRQPRVCRVDDSVAPTSKPPQKAFPSDSATKWKVRRTQTSSPAGESGGQNGKDERNDRQFDGGVRKAPLVKTHGLCRNRFRGGHADTHRASQTQQAACCLMQDSSEFGPPSERETKDDTERQVP
ncbi:hypothetical protein NCLIV_062020 [Neospora caninum Liverpool]|uniref:Uncharacterized protein n=1 Tax=Neospora caninum (strain Liverpool) TaxID=572307 RepID=F0VPX9_NEOCL|nr:hypothetical protein NCLIV_062020 [Neospora caninum Liverpool]CBZ55776.1 hypothetical protein NCLIV_062020 [Neospora caninum Liverpool]CEL70520.1 TPA: hypothetical protein BN1204_062020 [Neospora caninum Liverpool]|eukprot:XP_003885802.1 hypothetical protein NCLIV_062020 [Neospora caninum Liverpool]